MTITNTIPTIMIIVTSPSECDISEREAVWFVISIYPPFLYVIINVAKAINAIIINNP
jgi:hypothetical protein